MAFSGFDGDTWTLRGIRGRVSQVLRGEGPKDLLFKMLAATVYRRVVLFSRPPSEPGDPEPCGLPVVSEELDESHVSEFVAFHPGTTESMIRDRLQAGHRCMTVRVDGQLVHARWLALHRAWIDFMECEIRLGPGNVYDYDIYTDSRYRERGLSRSVGHLWHQQIRDTGCKRMIGLVVPENRRIYEKARKRLERIGTLHYLKVGPWKKHFLRLSPRAKETGSLVTLA